MSLTLYNSLTRRESPFDPIEPSKVRMYCCGVTVYDYCHVGHARAYIVWDMVRRYLMWRGYSVRYVQNFTDIDDKILDRARETNSTMEAVAERFIDEYFADMDKLNILRADEYPRATHSIDGIKRLIHELENKGFAYANSGDVYYSVRKFDNYGKLSGRKLEEMEAGASGRLETAEIEAQKKQDSSDFALWKSAKPGEPFWESSWGKGRPGWHIECSAMVRDCLGETIDIHCGGSDLTFPHHENEIAQSEAATGKSLANYWMHNAFVTVNGRKMSKSLHNFITIRDLLEGNWSGELESDPPQPPLAKGGSKSESDPPQPPLAKGGSKSENESALAKGGSKNQGDKSKAVEPMAVRLFVLMAQYRSQIDFTEDAIANAQNGWNTINEGLLFGLRYAEKLNWDVEKTGQDTKAVQQFQAAMDNDFNTPAALAVLFELAKELGKESNVLVHQGKTETSPELLQLHWLTLVSLAGVLGLEVQPEADSDAVVGGLSDAEIEAMIQQRKDARIARNFAEGDRLRNELKDRGITLIDQKDGTTIWHRS
ncbi:MAG: cysteine--tRNA ligase [Microcoleus sp. PH2017_29_MFU_D_A]|uniref:cysteine--tRNA ligase n=1 Tax=unclassified Microcoleus TaxID=2642155 RepID=UPI001DC48664|nr:MULTISPECIES: cysteine--tRNA ligase [unclassified Microcoleus]MCC3603317.1 cysteine--tRNA ligase [Microcoleus sp. PH2017_29_MFU_D_A]MCC3634468.1 cysteine--tRNA ligase [Microcoleus sp. PH2017_37_MFU_D_B]